MPDPVQTGQRAGHLGVFTDAKERLERARDMFATAGDMDAAATVSGILAGLEEAAGADLMEMFARAHFDVLLREAAGNFAERCVHQAGDRIRRCQRFRDTPADLGLSDFVNAFLRREPS